MDILRAVYKSRPNVTWKNNSVNGFDLKTIKAAYIGEDFPVQSELDSAWILCQEEDALNNIMEQLSNTDQAVIRVLEDLIEILIQKGNISLADFSSQAQEKIATREALRDRLNGG
jgi:hypothetical protein